MTEPGGPTTQSGIVFQNSIAALYLGRMLDARQADKDRPVQVRIEAPENVDDIVVKYPDGSRLFIQAKEKIAEGSDPWKKLWKDFEAQRWNSDFGESDRLVLALGDYHEEFYSLVSELCDRAKGSLTPMEWYDRIKSKSENPERLSALERQREKIRSLLIIEDQSDEMLLQLFSHVDVEIIPSKSILHDKVPDWIPRGSLTPEALFLVFLGMCGYEARIRSAFEPEVLLDRLKQNKIIIYFIDAARAENALLRRQFDELLRNRLSLFGGRELVIQQIEEFIANPQGRYLVITAPAGFGKTALSAYIASHHQDTCAYHFFTSAYNADGLNEDFFLRNILQQMSFWHNQNEILPFNLSELKSLYWSVLNAPFQESRFLLLNGLDELRTWKIDGYLGGHLPEQTGVILTIRDVGQDWKADYKLPDEKIIHLPLEGLEATEVAAVLRAAGGQAVELAADEEIVADICKIAAFTEEQYQSVSGADPFYVRLLAEDLAAGVRDKASLAKQPLGLGVYLDQWWQDVYSSATDQPLLDLISLLAAGLGPLKRPDLEAILGAMHIELVEKFKWNLEYFPELVKKIRRFVVYSQDGDYALMHPRLRDYLVKNNKIPIGLYQGKLIEFCAGWAQHASEYAFKHYAEHLKISGRNPELYYLICKEWKGAKFARYSNHQSFSLDIDIAIQAAGEEINLPELVRVCLLYTTLGELATDVPPDILGVLARFGQAEGALGYAALVQDAARRCDAYRLIGGGLLAVGDAPRGRAVLQKALAMAENMENDNYQDKAIALTGVAQALAQAGDRDGLRQALVAAEKMGDEQHNAEARSGVVQALAQAGDQEGIEQALLAEMTGVEYFQASALSGVAQALAQAGDREGALAAAEKIGSEYVKAIALIDLAKMLAQIGDPDGAVATARQAQEWAEKIWNEERKSEALSGVAQALAQSGDREGALAAAEKIEDKWYKTQALSGVAQALALSGDREELRQVLAAAEKIEGEESKVQALSGVMEALAQSGDREGLRQVLAAAEKIEGEESKAQALSGVAQALAQAGDREGALAVAEKIDSEEAKAQALSGVAQALAQAGDREGALAVAEKIEDEEFKSYPLSGVAQALAQAGDREGALDAAQQALAAAEKIKDERYKADALIKVAQALAQISDRDGALAAADKIEDMDLKTKTLIDVAQTLAQAGNRDGALDAARRVLTEAEGNGNEYFIARALSIVAQARTRLGDQDGALDAARQALVAAKEIRYEFQRAIAFIVVGLALAQAGDSDGLQQVLVMAQKIEEEVFLVVVYYGLSKGLAQASDQDWSLGALLSILGQEAKFWEDDEKVRALSIVIKARTRVGDQKGALDAARQALAAEEKNVGGGQEKADAWNGVLLALAQASNLDGMRQALVAAEKIKDEGLKAAALSRVAQALHASGDIMPSEVCIMASEVFGRALQSTRFADREAVFACLESGTELLVDLNQGETLRQVVAKILEVARWWGG